MYRYPGVDPGVGKGRGTYRLNSTSRWLGRAILGLGLVVAFFKQQIITS